MAVTEVKQALPTDVEGPGLVEYLGVFTRRPKTIIFPLLIMTVVAGLIAYVIPPKYESFTQFKVRDPGLTRGLLSGTQAVVPHKPLLATIGTDIIRPGFYMEIVRRVGLTEGFNLNDPEELSDFFKYIDKNLVVKPSFTKSGSDLVTISYQGRDRKKVALFVSEVLDGYRNYFKNRYRGLAERLYRAAESGLRAHERTLVDLQADYNAFRSGPDYSLVSVRRQLANESGSLAERRTELEVTLNGLQGQLQRVLAQIRDQKTSSVTMKFVPNPEKSELKLLLDQERAALNVLITVKGLTDLTPTVKAQKKKIEGLEQRYAAMDDLIAGGQEVGPNKLYQTLVERRDDVLAQIEGVKRSLDKVEKRLVTVRKNLERIPDLQAQDDKFRRDIGRANERVIQAQKKFATIEGEWNRIKSEGGDLFDVQEYPRDSDPPVFPSVPLFLGLGAAAGLLLGLGLAFLKEFSGMTYTSSSQVQATLPLPILGEVACIPTDEEIAEQKKRARSLWLVLGSVALILGVLHLLYFSQGLQHYLPPFLADLMDSIYKGR